MTGRDFHKTGQYFVMNGQDIHDDGSIFSWRHVEIFIFVPFVTEGNDGAEWV